MLLFILKRLMNAVFLLLLIALIGHWMIQNIPGSYDEMNRRRKFGTRKLHFPKDQNALVLFLASFRKETLKS
ncbi:MAG: hypothetical protein IPL25_13720 [Saprospiraceae bacterium]|nr:hypothetical protein [Candidatus Vicinibacter affinis]